MDEAGSESPRSGQSSPGRDDAAIAETDEADPSSTTSRRQSDPLRGIALKVAAVAIFVAMQAFIKAAGPLPSGQIVFFRSFFAIFPILVFLALRSELHLAFRTGRPLGHVMRGVVGVAAMGLGFYALTRLPLPEAIALSYAQPMLVVIFGAMFLGEIVRLYRWTAVTIGLLGVGIVSWPKLTLFMTPEGIGDAEAAGIVAALLAAAFAAVAMLLVRNLVHTERTSTIVLWFSMVASVISLVSLPFGWSALSLWPACLLIAAGFCGGVAQILMTEGYRYADVSTMAPFEYTSMLLGIAVGYLAFAEIPTLHTLVGGAIVIGAGVFIILREHWLGLERGAARRATSPQ